MFKFTGTGKKNIAANCGGLLIGAFMLYGIIDLVVMPSKSIAGSNRSRVKIEKSIVSPNLIAGDSGRPISNTSGSAEMALANHLRKKGVKMYGAFWCGACGRQKELFGQQAFAKLRYIECDPRGVKPNRQACNQAGVNAYPTWVLSNGQKGAGVLSLTDLANASGYTGPRNFKN